MKALASVVAIGLFFANASAIAQVEPLVKVRALYPLRAVDRGTEGWVELRFDVDPDGSTTNIKIVDSFPRRVFDEASESAVAKWRYPPAAEKRQSSAVLTFALLDAGATRSGVVDLIDQVARAIAQGEITSGRKLLEKAASTDDLTLTEMVLIQRVTGNLAYAEKRYGDASTAFNRALQILGPLLELEPRASLVRSLLIARVNAGEFQDAVSDFDRWCGDDVAYYSDVAPTIEAIRAALSEGRPISLPSP